MDEILTPNQWAGIKGALKQKYPELTETDLLYQEASEHDMLVMIEYILRKTEEKLTGIYTTQRNRISPDGMVNLFRKKTKRRLAY